MPSWVVDWADASVPNFTHYIQTDIWQSFVPRDPPVTRSNILKAKAVFCGIIVDILCLTPNIAVTRRESMDRDATSFVVKKQQPSEDTTYYRSQSDAIIALIMCLSGIDIFKMPQKRFGAISCLSSLLYY